MSKSLGLSRHVLGASTTVTRGLACISQCHIQPLASITFCQPTRDNTLSTAHTKAAVVEPTSALALAQARSIHTSASTENPLIVGGIAVAAGAIAVRYGMEVSSETLHTCCRVYFPTEHVSAVYYRLTSHGPRNESLQWLMYRNITKVISRMKCHYERHLEY